MKKALPPIHHSLLLNAQSADSSTAWSMEFTVLRSQNGFTRRSELTAILEKRDPQSGSLLRKIVRLQLPFPEDLTSPQDLVGKAWSLGQIRSQDSCFSGQVRAPDGDFIWDLAFPNGHPLDYSPLPRWVHHHTLSTQIPIQGSWQIGDWKWSSQQTPVLGSLHIRQDLGRIFPTVRFHSQLLRESAGGVQHCADGIHIPIFPALTQIAAFDALKGNPHLSLWRALRSRMQRDDRGWHFRAEQGKQELRGKLEVEPKHWTSLRFEDTRGSVFYRTSTRMAELEILVLSRGKPQGHFKSSKTTWLEWTSRTRPDSVDIY